MKQIIITILTVFFMTICIPFITVSIMSGSKPVQSDEKISVYISQNGAGEDMDKEEYICGVVAANMPADFDIEALKAQAVAARSYLEYKSEQSNSGGGDEEHKEYVICTDKAHCTAWTSLDDKAGEWGDKAQENTEKIKKAVNDTRGIIMTYENKPIAALYHRSNGGKTENASDVWGEDIPYLASVDSLGDSDDPDYSGERVFGEDEFKRLAENGIGAVDWSKDLFSDIQRSGGGAIKEIKIGNSMIKGVKLMDIFALKSTNADIRRVDNCVVITVKGNGHGVGMSQYGAQYLATHGKSYKQILRHYYKGIRIRKQS